MFVKSNMEVAVKYNKGNNFIEIKPMTVTYIKDGLVTPKELTDCYGQRIIILSNDQAEDVIEEQVTDNEIERLGDEEADNTPVEANTGDEEVDNFLNGKTDVVPEGTEEITEEEALKLKAQADAEAKAKEETEKLEALKAKEAAERADKEEAKKADKEVDKEDAKKAASKQTKAPAKNKGAKKNNK